MAIVINGSGEISGISVGGLPDGIVDAGTLAVNSRGTVLQVVQGTNGTGNTASTSSTYADVGLSATITPISTSNKILVSVELCSCVKETGNTYFGVLLLRNTTSISCLTTVGGNTVSTTTNNIGSISTTYLDSPSTTSATTYKVQFASLLNVSKVMINNWDGVNQPTSTITLMEVAG